MRIRFGEMYIIFDGIFLRLTSSSKSIGMCMSIVTFFLDMGYKGLTHFLVIQHHCGDTTVTLISLGLLRTTEPIDGKSFMFTSW